MFSAISNIFRNSLLYFDLIWFLDYESTTPGLLIIQKPNQIKLSECFSGVECVFVKNNKISFYGFLEFYVISKFFRKKFIIGIFSWGLLFFLNMLIRFANIGSGGHKIPTKPLLKLLISIHCFFPKKISNHNLISGVFNMVCYCVLYIGGPI